MKQIIIGVLFVGVIIGYFLYKNIWFKNLTPQNKERIIQTSPTPSTTISPFQNWNTITNTQYQFSIQYPSSIQAQTTGMDPSLEAANEIVFSEDPLSDTEPVLYINAANKNETVYKNMSLEEIVNANYAAQQENPHVKTQITKNLEKTTFVGTPAFTYEMNTNAYSGKWHGFTLPKNDYKVIEFENNAMHYTFVVPKIALFEQIVSTFLLIKPTIIKPTILEKNNSGFVCPPGEYVDCMPGPNRGVRFECTAEFLNWSKDNCPGFKGAAL